MNFGLAMFQGLAAIIGAVNAIAAAAEPYEEQARQSSWNNMPVKIPDVPDIIEANVRGTLDNDKFFEAMQVLGYQADEAALMRLNRLALATDELIIAAFRREIIDETEFKARMNARGWKDEDIPFILKTTEYYPTPSDLISWISREAYEEDSIARYGLADELELVDAKPFLKGGMTQQQLRNYWVAHWQTPPWTQVQKWRHYDILNDNDVLEWFRLVEIPKFWRQKYVDTIYEPLTRVDVRRMWDMEVLSDAEVVVAYRRLGYSQADSENLLVFTKLERRMPELRERYKNGWITDTELRSELRGIGLKEDRIEPVAQRLQKNDRPAAVVKEKDLTKTDILKAAKRENVTIEQALTLLAGIGYSRDEATLLLKMESLDVGNSAESYVQLQSVVQSYRKAIGLPHKLVPDDILATEARLLDAVERLQSAAADGLTDEELQAFNREIDGIQLLFNQQVSRWDSIPLPTE